MANVPQKLELPSITRKKQQEWAEMDSIYNSSYSGLTSAVVTIGVIVAMKDRLPPQVDVNKLTNMVASLNKDIENLRTRLNDIHTAAQKSRHEDMDMMDVNMECIQIASDYRDWGNQFQTLCSQPLGDIITYVEQ